MWETLPLCLRLERNGDQNKSLGRLLDSVAHPVDTRESHMGQSSGMERRPSVRRLERSLRHEVGGQNESESRGWGCMCLVLSRQDWSSTLLVSQKPFFTLADKPMLDIQS